MVPKSPFILEMCQDIARHMRAKGVWPDCSAEDIHKSADVYEQIPSWWYDALAYFNERDYYYTLDDVQSPQEGQYVSVRKPGYIDGYQYRNGKWVETGGFSTYS
ncbi:hypothetical protein PUW25_25995 (plasmid) [Paenibacillus urinalis]|uniref:Uncharacterized protein n=1 Tax=Paenibacillus urinalis TaxID=521520 RepID=A0ABY7XHD8_9BACL|nr:hypothetical protein [Paenibacillus urinalis]WDI05023.1 hypothetical protein PUW25_25995 [Paenibacillus urinalis]